MKILGYEISIRKIQPPVEREFTGATNFDGIFNNLSGHARGRLMNRFGLKTKREQIEFLKQVKEIKPSEVFHQMPETFAFVSGEITFIVNRGGRIITVKQTSHCHPRGMENTDFDISYRVRSNLVK